MDKIKYWKSDIIRIENKLMSIINLITRIKMNPLIKEDVKQKMYEVFKLLEKGRNHENS